ncbi:hypothetical protein PT974_06997 [Cladobotryum mycophilum]|uniref:Methyltransferase type 11 domain-containing protein n=1 Tax=Cladobotryum mycophilum TaxID=491253 RepID=A0ABR0SN81_9HYPO
MVYDEINTQNPPVDHIHTIAMSVDTPPKLTQADFGLDSLFGLLLSSVAAPLYLYASLKGKFHVWDDILADVSDEDFRSPTLDVGCGRGMVLLKMAQRKKNIADMTSTNVCPTYGIDIFNTSDQTGNSPNATYQNAEAMDVLNHTVLHTASFAERFPFADNTFSLITTNLALHNANKDGRITAMREMARVCKPGGRIVLVDLYGYFGDHKTVLQALGWKNVDVSLVGFRMMFGSLPCQILTATKPMQ